MTDLVNPLDKKPVGKSLAEALVPPKPEAELTADQKRIRELEDQLAQSQGKKELETVLEPLANPGSEENIIIHFLEDGFTALGQVFYRGMELEFEPGSQAYEDTKDRFGKSWLDMRNDEFEQVDRFGKIMFRVGLWPGQKGYKGGKFAALKSLGGDGRVEAPSDGELTAAEEAERRRARIAPTIPKM